jgi:N6-adenosine-specific RNA methylase IME4
MPLSKKNKRYGTIYADPPWYFKNFSAKGEGRNATSHYDCMRLDEICALPVSDLAMEDCALFLWAIDPMLPQALRVIDAWGFTFKTIGFYWVKLNKSADMENLKLSDFFCGLGYWTRANVEQCLLATRGNPNRVASDVRRLVVEKRREHSRKPEEVYRRIERLTNGPYLELFGRESRPNWDSWGNEPTLFDRGSVNTRRQPSNLTRTKPAQGSVPLGD